MDFNRLGYHLIDGDNSRVTLLTLSFEEFSLSVFLLSMKNGSFKSLNLIPNVYILYI